MQQKASSLALKEDFLSFEIEEQDSGKFLARCPEFSLFVLEKSADIALKKLESLCLHSILILENWGISDFVFSLVERDDHIDIRKWLSLTSH